MSFISEFKEFALKGNMIDMATGIIIGAAFSKVVDSLVKDIIMPPIAAMMGGVDFKYLFVNLSDTAYATLAEAEAAGAPVIRYGNFFTVIIDFTILAFTIFVAIKIMNRIRRKDEAKKA